MEPCPYRQGEAGLGPEAVARPAGAAMEPCPYRQGEALPTAGEVTVEKLPQWSPALIGRERLNRDEYSRPGLPQWSPALIGRESGRPGGRPAAEDSGRNGALPLSAGRATGVSATGSKPNVGRNGALPLSAGREFPAPWSVILASTAAMEPCPYRQGEVPRLTCSGRRS